MSFLPPNQVSRTTAAAVPTPTRGYVLAPTEGVPDRDAEVKASNASTGGSLAIYRTVVDGQGPPWHEHRLEDETIVVLDGTMQAECGEDVFTGGPGSTIFLPRGLPHTFRSLDGPATILFILTPGHLDEFFRSKEELDDREEIIALAQRFF